MKFSLSMVLTASCFAAALAACGEPTARTTMASETRSTTAAGGETQTNINETREQGSNGEGTSRRTETVEQSTPARTPAR